VTPIYIVDTLLYTFFKVRFRDSASLMYILVAKFWNKVRIRENTEKILKSYRQAVDRV
jgi:hypothetical protein